MARAGRLHFTVTPHVNQKQALSFIKLRTGPSNDVIYHNKKNRSAGGITKTGQKACTNLYHTVILSLLNILHTYRLTNNMWVAVLKCYYHMDSCTYTHRTKGGNSPIMLQPSHKKSRCSTSGMICCGTPLDPLHTTMYH